MSATPKFKNAVEEILKTVGQKEHHGAFKVKLIKNLLSTPWCTENQWGSILQGSEPFSKNITLADYVPNDFIDDNEFFAH
jgi:hypothetical protein